MKNSNLGITLGLEFDIHVQQNATEAKKQSDNRKRVEMNRNGRRHACTPQPKRMVPKIDGQKSERAG